MRFNWNSYFANNVSLIVKPGFKILVILSLMLGLSACGNNVVFTNCDGEGICSSTIEVTRYKGELPVSPRSGFWNSKQGPKKVTVELGPQLITNPQWPNPSIKEVTISAARTNSEIAIRLEWEDDGVDSGQGQTRMYTDQAAALFPLNRNRELPPITMGAEGETVNIWIWKASRDLSLSGAVPPDAPSPVEDLNAEGFSTLTRQDKQDVKGQGYHTGSRWQVVLKRKLTDNQEEDAQFTGSTPMAVAVWNGGNRETNGQKGLSDWIFLKFI